MNEQKGMVGEIYHPTQNSPYNYYALWVHKYAYTINKSWTRGLGKWVDRPTRRVGAAIFSKPRTWSGTGSQEECIRW